MRIGHALTGALVVTAMGMISGCGERGTQDAAPSRPTATVTATETVEATVTATPRPKPARTVTATPEPAPTQTVTVTAEPDPVSDLGSGPAGAEDEEDEGPSSIEEFDKGWARTTGRYITEDMASVEERLPTNMGVSSSLSFLTDSYADLMDAGVPSSADPATWTSRLDTLSSFAAQAAQEWDAGNTRAAAARYEVIRRETGPVFGVLNRELGTTFTVPQR